MEDVIAPYSNNEICEYSEGQVSWKDLGTDNIIDCIDSDYNPDPDSDGDGIVDY